MIEPREFPDRRRFLRSAAALAVGASWTTHGRVARSAEVLPKHINAETLKAIREGLDFLARSQSQDGAWHDGQGGQSYPVAVSSLAAMALLAQGNTPSRGKYAPQLAAVTDYLVKCSGPNGMLSGPGEELGRPMHGHGFALMYLASVYGAVIKESKRKRIARAIDAAIKLTAEGQSPAGGWTYIPSSGDEGSVTVTQVQALRAAHNAGFKVPRSTIESAVQYIEKCMTPSGGIRYALRSGGNARLPISAAAVATMYNAGKYDSPAVEKIRDYVWSRFKSQKRWSKGGGHDFYCQLYAAQAFYMAGDEFWDEYFPSTRDQLIAMQDKSEGSWNGDGIGKTYGTGIALVILQLPFKYLPVFQR